MRKFGSLEAWKFSFVGEGFRPTPLLGADWLIGRRLSPDGSQNQSMACEARHALQASGPDVRFARTHGPPLRRLLAVEGLSLRACTVSFVRFVINPHWQSCVR